MKGGAIVDSRGVTNPADAPVEAVASQPQRATPITEADTKDPKRLAELLNKLQSDLGEAQRSLLSSPHAGGWIEYRDVTTVAGTNISLRHGFGRRARFAVVDAQSNAPGFTRDASTTDSILVLTPTASGTVSLLVF